MSFSSSSTLSDASPSDAAINSLGTAVVRVKPLGAGGGGVERTAVGLTDGEAAIRYVSTFTSSSRRSSTSIDPNLKGKKSPTGNWVSVPGTSGRCFDYMNHLVPPDVNNEQLYEQFVPQRIDSFFNGINVNLLAYGQTGSGKTHTMFGAPGILEQAGKGGFGVASPAEYGIFPRAALAIFQRFQRMQATQHGGGSPAAASSALSAPGPRCHSNRYVLTAHAVELSMVEGNQDMLNRKTEDQACSGSGFASEYKYGVCIDRATKPPRVFGMEEMILRSEADLFRFFGHVANRATMSTKMNHSSSRSHCFVTLALYTLSYNDESGESKKSATSSLDGKMISITRFQFVDMAGSERMEDAHGSKDYRSSTQAMSGMAINFSLMMLNQAIRGLVECRKNKKEFSYRAYMFDLILLLGQSLSGEAATTVFLCISQAPANVATTLTTLDFGSVWSQLSNVSVTKVPAVAAMSLVEENKALHSMATSALTNNVAAKFRTIRQGQVLDSKQRLHILSHLLGTDII